MDFNNLVGSIGAYIGLFLGYSALQIPDFIRFVSQQFKKYLRKRRFFVHNDVQNALKIDVKEALSDNINKLSTTTNPNSDVLQIIQIKLENMSQKVDVLEKFALKMNGNPE
jgi:hypothetical protein